MNAPHHKKILVIEDEPDIQEMLSFNLEQEGYQVLSCDSGEKGLDLLAKNLPDLVLLDLMLPGIDGLTICRAIRGHADTKHIPIIVLSARADESDRVQGLELGADDYVTKPFSPKELVARVAAVQRRTTGHG